MKINKMKVTAMASLLLAAAVICCGCNNQGLPAGNGTINALAMTEPAIEKINAISEEYHDNYSVYYPRDEYESLLEDIEGKYTGIGVTIYENEENGRVTVNSVMRGAPAYKAGLQPGDEILQVNGESVTAQTTEYVSKKFKTAAVGTKFTLLINRPEAGEKTITVQTDNVEYPTVDSLMLENTDGIGLIKISTFNLLTGDQFLEQLKDLKEQGMKGLILDLRDNGGGEINAAMKVANSFLGEDSNLMYMVTPQGTYSYSGDGEAEQLPLMVLQNGNTASASEVVIGALAEKDNVITLGTKTFGKGIVQTITELNSGAGLRFTSARYLTGTGKEVHKIGIMPDVEFDQPEGTHVLASYAMDPAEDPQLAKGIEEFQKFMADAAQ